MSNNRTNSGQAQGTKKPKPHRFHHSWKGWAILTGCFCIIALFILRAMTTDFTRLLFSHASVERKIQSSNSEMARTGTIVLQTGENRCEFKKFDNNNGRMIAESIKPCNDPVTLDSRGVPLPMGTVRRLDAISKSLGNVR